MKKAGPVILGITGSIAAYRACDIISALRKESIDVQAILTKEAAEFITPLSVQTLSCNKVITEMFAMPEKWEPIHTSIADKAALILIAPATANIIGKLANGICDDMLTCVTYATKAPVLIAPAMNDVMYKNRIVQENIAKLKKIGYKFVGPKVGRLACGYEAIGCLADVEIIVKEIENNL